MNELKLGAVIHVKKTNEQLVLVSITESRVLLFGTQEVSRERISFDNTSRYITVGHLVSNLVNKEWSVRFNG